VLTHFTDADLQLTRRIGFADLHSDLPLGLLKRRFDGREGSLTTEWLPRLRAGGVNLVVCAVYIDSIFLPESALRRAVQLVDALLEEIAACPEIELALSLADVERITAEGNIAALLAFEGAEPLGQDLAVLRLFYRLGLRMLSFAWMRRTAFGDGAWENDSRGGLTRLGRQAVDEMNRLGIIVDVSHASDQTTWDVLESSTQPVIASHSNVRAIRDHPRNLTDPMIALVGIDHVAVGCDFYDEIMAMGAAHEIPAWNPGGSLGQLSFTGMRTWADLPGLTAELLRRGYREGDLRKICYGNFSRVMEAVLSV
jgi:membrane dipeptidase